MPPLAEFLVNATALSALYALIAIGFTMIFGVGGVMNFAHGALITLGAFTAYLVADATAGPYGIWIAFPVAIVVTGLAGLALYVGLVRPVQNRPVVVLLVTLLVGFIVRHAVRVAYGVGAFTVPQPIPGQTTVAGIDLFHHRLFVFAASWVLVGLLVALVRYTELGRSILATSMDQRGAKLVGIDTARINGYTWVVAAVLAGVAGVLLAGYRTGSWEMGLEPMVLSFSIVVLGGLGSIRGSIVGAYVIGFLETGVTVFVSTRLTGIVSLLLLLVVLLVRPSGLYGREVPT